MQGARCASGCGIDCSIVCVLACLSPAILVCQRLSTAGERSTSSLGLYGSSVALASSPGSRSSPPSLFPLSLSLPSPPPSFSLPVLTVFSDSFLFLPRPHYLPMPSLVALSSSCQLLPYSPHSVWMQQVLRHVTDTSVQHSATDTQRYDVRMLVQPGRRRVDRRSRCRARAASRRSMALPPATPGVSSSHVYLDGGGSFDRRG